MGKHSTCKGSLYTPKGGRFLPLHGSLCFYALRAFLPSVPRRARHADHGIKFSPECMHSLFRPAWQVSVHRRLPIVEAAVF